MRFLFAKPKKTIFGIGVFVLLLSIPIIVSGSTGVGVGLGEIKVDQPLKAGKIYNLPSVPVLNTGDEASKYEVSIEYHQNQQEKEEMGLKPAENWVSFSPESFHLQPGETKVVETTLILPVKTKPGDYFAYLEAHPITDIKASLTE